MTSIDPRHLFVGYVDEIRLVEVEVEARGLACGLKSLREISLCVCALHGVPVAPTWRCIHP